MNKCGYYKVLPGDYLHNSNYCTMTQFLPDVICADC